MINFSVYRQHVKFGRVQRSNIQECSRRSKFSHETCLHTLVCFMRFYAGLGDQIDKKKVPNIQTNVFGVNKSSYKSPRTPEGSLRRTKKVDSALPRQCQKTLLIDKPSTRRRLVDGRHHTILRIGAKSPIFQILYRKRRTCKMELLFKMIVRRLKVVDGVYHSLQRAV